MSAALMTLERVKHLQVSAVAKTPGPLSDALLAVAAGDRKAWTLAAWLDLLLDLDTYPGTVDDWLTLRR